MSPRLKYMLLFPIVAAGNFSALLKNLLHFTEFFQAKTKVKEAGFAKGLPTIDISDLIPKLNEEVNKFTFLDGTSRVIDLALLKALAKRFDKCDYLEIGSWRGESVVNVAPYCNEVVSLSLPKEDMKAMKFSQEAIDLDGFLMDNIPNLKRIAHNSLTFDFKSLHKKFDLIFVDGDHSYEAVLSDTLNVFPLLKNERSVIVWHDCGNLYEDQRWEVIAGVLGGATEEQRKHIYRVSNSLCGIYIKGNFKKQHRSIPHKPDYVFDVTIKQSSL